MIDSNSVKLPSIRTVRLKSKTYKKDGTKQFLHTTECGDALDRRVIHRTCDGELWPAGERSDKVA